MPNERSYTPRELAKVLRVSPDKIRNWIKTGQLGAINTADIQCAKPRFVVLPKHLEEFENRRQAGPPQKLQKRRKRKSSTSIDFYPN